MAESWRTWAGGAATRLGGAAAESPRGGQGQDRGKEGRQGRWRLSGAKEVRGQGPGPPEMNLLGVHGPGSACSVGDHWEGGCTVWKHQVVHPPPSPCLHTYGFGVLGHLPACHRDGQGLASLSLPALLCSIQVTMRGATPESNTMAALCLCQHLLSGHCSLLLQCFGSSCCFPSPRCQLPMVIQLWPWWYAVPSTVTSDLWH